MNKFYTSDHHGGHYNCMKYCKRPFNCPYGASTFCEHFCGRPAPTCLHYVHEMMIERWNSKVTDKDHVVYLGDLAMDDRQYKILHRLNFGSMDWILGNHDKIKKVNRFLDRNPGLAAKIKVYDSKDDKVGDIDVYLVHRPITGSDEKPTVCGHVHERWTRVEAGTLLKEHNRQVGIIEKLLKQPCVNVGVDRHDFYPLSEEELLKLLIDDKVKL